MERVMGRARLFGLAILASVWIAALGQASMAMAQSEAAHRVLGVGVEPLDGANLPPKGPVLDYGVKVVVVQAGSAASSAGIAVGDILLSLDGEPILKKGDIQRIVASRAAGSIVSIHLVRNGVAMDIATQL
jgi:S1-C subfamily serine protease